MPATVMEKAEFLKLLREAARETDLLARANERASTFFTQLVSALEDEVSQKSSETEVEF